MHYLHYNMLNYIFITFNILFLSSFIHVTLSTSSTSSFSDYSYYFEEYRFDWNNLNDWDENDCTITELLHKSHTKLCLSQSPQNIKFSSHNTYYNDINLNFDNDNDWNAISSIDGINGYSAISKCQSLQLIEICAIYNPYNDNFQINTKILKKRHKKDDSFSSAHEQEENLLSYSYDDNIDINQLLSTKSIDTFTNLALKDYNDNNDYNQHRITTLQQKHSKSLVF